MARHPFSTSHDYLQTIRGFRDLHALTLAGRDDAPEADAIRDEMDQHWYNISETEQRRMKGLSEDLYSISDPPQEPLPSNPQVQRKLEEVGEVKRAGKWDEALELLRRWSRHIDPAILSYQRGTIWHEAGDDATANQFFGHAARLDPEHFEHAYLVNSWNSDGAAGQKLAQEILAAETAHSVEVVFTASCIRFMDTRGKLIAECQTDLAGIISALERSVTRAKGDDLAFPAMKETTIKRSLFLLACCHERLSNSRAAVRYLDEALSIDPHDPGMFMVRGIFRYGVEPSSVDDFKKASELGSRDVWPSFYLAHHSLVSDRFEDCLRMCERGLTFTAPDEVKAILHEWLAIARSEMRFPTEQVRSAFEDAIRLAPDTDRIRSNFAAFESALANPTGPRPEWIKPRATAVQSFGRSGFQPPLPLPPQPLPLMAA